MASSRGSKVSTYTAIAEIQNSIFMNLVIEMKLYNKFERP